MRAAFCFICAEAISCHWSRSLLLVSKGGPTRPVRSDPQHAGEDQSWWAAEFQCQTSGFSQLELSSRRGQPASVSPDQETNWLLSNSCTLTREQSRYVSSARHVPVFCVGISGQTGEAPSRHLPPQGSGPNKLLLISATYKVIPATGNCVRAHRTELKAVPHQPESAEVLFTWQNPLSAAIITPPPVSISPQQSSSPKHLLFCSPWWFSAGTPLHSSMIRGWEIGICGHEAGDMRWRLYVDTCSHAPVSGLTLSISATQSEGSRLKQHFPKCS